MVNIIRRFQQPLMIAITVMVIIAFAWLYNDTRFMDKAGTDRVGTIYGRTVTLAEAQKIGRKFELSRDLGLFELLQALAIRQQDAKENFIWNSLVLRHESDLLGTEPSNAEVIAAIQAMQVFRTNGVYDSAKYSLIVQNALTPRGFTPDDMEDLVRDDLRLKKIKTLLGATLAAAESEVRAAYEEMNRKTEASVIRLKLEDFLAIATASEEEVQKRFEAQKAQLKSEELRTVKAVGFTLPITDKPLAGKDRVDALKKLQQQAEDFAVAMTEKNANLEAAATAAGVKIEDVRDLARGGTVPQLADSPEATATAFHLTKAEPNSDVIGTDRGYYVLQLASITEAHPLTFEEAKAKLAEQVKRERAQEALTLQATAIRNQIEAAIKAGQAFADAASAAGVKPEPVPAFSRNEPKTDLPDAREILGTAFDLSEGALSPFVPTETGGVLVHVDKRLPADDAKFAEEKQRLTTSVNEFKRSALFQQWLKLRLAAAGLQHRGQG